MAYTEELRQLINIVEKTRPERLARKKAGEDVPPMSLEERDAILRKFHPDYMEDQKRPLKIGPNKGYGLPLERVGSPEPTSRRTGLRSSRLQ